MNYIKWKPLVFKKWMRLRLQVRYVKTIIILICLEVLERNEREDPQIWSFVSQIFKVFWLPWKCLLSPETGSEDVAFFIPLFAVLRNISINIKAWRSSNVSWGFQCLLTSISYVIWGFFALIFWKKCSGTIQENSKLTLLKILRFHLISIPGNSTPENEVKSRYFVQCNNKSTTEGHAAWLLPPPLLIMCLSRNVSQKPQEIKLKTLYEFFNYYSSSSYYILELLDQAPSSSSSWLYIFQIYTITDPGKVIITRCKILKNLRDFPNFF